MELNVGIPMAMRISRQIPTYQKQLDNVEYFNSLVSMITNDASCACEIKSRISMAKTEFHNTILFTSKRDLKSYKKLKCYVRSISLYGAEPWALRKVDQKYMERFEMCCWRRLEKTSWTDRVKNEKVLHRVKERRNTLRTITRRTVIGLVTSCVRTVF
jgi:hypothetical protein